MLVRSVLCHSMRTITNPVSAGAASSPASSNPEARFISLPLVATRSELATVLHCTERHLSNLERRGILRPIRLGRIVRYRRESILASLKNLEV